MATMKHLVHRIEAATRRQGIANPIRLAGHLTPQRFPSSQGLTLTLMVQKGACGFEGYVFPLLASYTRPAMNKLVESI